MERQQGPLKFYRLGLCPNDTVIMSYSTSAALEHQHIAVHRVKQEKQMFDLQFEWDKLEQYLHGCVHSRETPSHPKTTPLLLYILVKMPGKCSVQKLHLLWNISDTTMEMTGL